MLSHMEWRCVFSGVKWPEHEDNGLKLWNFIFAAAVFLRGASRRRPDDHSRTNNENEHITNFEVTLCTDGITEVGIAY